MSNDPEWVKANPDKVAEYQRRWRAAHPETYRARAKAYREQHKARDTAKARERRASADAVAREHQRAQKRAWRAANPARVIAEKLKRRAVGPVDYLAVKHVFDSADGMCAYCLRTGLKLEVDHVLPVVRGGTNDPNNLVAACRRCNAQKHKATPLEFMFLKGLAL